MGRKSLIAGNWKMHTTAAEARQLASGLLEACKQLDNRDVLLAPPYTALAEVSEAVNGSPVIVAAQNVCWAEKGAFTGEISPVMLKDCGISAVIVGHSERRQIFREDDELINRRLRGALSFGLLSILCIGETLQEREAGQTFTILERQIRDGLTDIDAAAMEGVVIAYEPVWAIGTGKTASTLQAQEAHHFIRGLLEKMYEKNIAEQTRILYGGSVKPTNVDELMAQPDIDGALVGGAALDVGSFSRIIQFNNN